jgi:hypothetical protein
MPQLKLSAKMLVGHKVNPVNTLDGAAATVPNARWRRVICAESLESLSPETKQPA